MVPAFRALPVWWVREAFTAQPSESEPGWDQYRCCGTQGREPHRARSGGQGEGDEVRGRLAGNFQGLLSAQKPESWMGTWGGEKILSPEQVADQCPPGGGRE